MPRTVTCLHHLKRPVLGHAAEALAHAGLDVEERDLRRGAPLPRLDETDAIISFGGEQSVRDIDSHPELAAEALLLRAAAETGVPLLGVCLGAQLLAHALGARVWRMESRLVAWAEVERLPAAADDPLLAGLGRTVRALHWNEDAFELPAGATELLSRAGEGCEAFRFGACAWGIQFHPEIDADALEGWYRQGADELREAGLSEAEARAADARHLERQSATGRALFGAFAATVAAAPAHG